MPEKAQMTSEDWQLFAPVTVRAWESLCNTGERVTIPDRER